VFIRSESGAAPVAGVVPLSVPALDGNESRYVEECIRTGWVSSTGPFVERFEAEFAARVGASHAVAVASGTAALHLALRLVGVQSGDLVITPALTFIAPANAVRYLGADPVFVDAEPRYWQPDPDLARRFLARSCERRGGSLVHRPTLRRVAALLPVHVLGHPVDLEAFCDLAAEFELPMVEDATESLGALWGGRATGTFGAIGCFSFNGNKIITTGGGGMLVTADAELAARARYLSTQAKDDPVEYVHGEVGYNYRLTNLQAAVGCAQLERLNPFLERKRAIAERYRAAFAPVGRITTPTEAPAARSNWWLYTIRVEDGSGGSSRPLLRWLEAAGVQARPLWQPGHLSPAYPDAIAAGGAVAAGLNRECLSLPSSSGLTPEQQQRVIDAVLEYAGTPAP
jgi:perosamine synthetase